MSFNEFLNIAKFEIVSLMTGIYIIYLLLFFSVKSKSKV